MRTRITAAAAVLGLATMGLTASAHAADAPPPPNTMMHDTTMAPAMAPGMPMMGAENTEAVGYLKQAKAALQKGNMRMSEELLERSETRFLTRGTDAAMAGQPKAEGPAVHIAAARQAIQGRNRAGALKEIDEAMSSAMSMGKMDGHMGTMGTDPMMKGGADMMAPKPAN